MFLFCGCSFSRSPCELCVLCGQTAGRHLWNDHRDDMESDEWANVDARQLNYSCDSRRTLTWRRLSALPSTALFLPSSRWQQITVKLCIMALLLRVWQLPVSVQMMDSARMPHSFLLDQYVNPLWSSASWSWETILIYESISEASGQTGDWGVCLDLYHPTSKQQSIHTKSKPYTKNPQNLKYRALRALRCSWYTKTKVLDRINNVFRI